MPESLTNYRGTLRVGEDDVRDVSFAVPGLAQAHRVDPEPVRAEMRRRVALVRERHPGVVVRFEVPWFSPAPLVEELA